MSNEIPVDQNGKVSDFWREFYMDYIGKNINCHLLGRVTNYDSSRHRCTVQPLPLTSVGNKRSPLVEVVVPANIYQQENIETAINGLAYSANNSEYSIGAGGIDLTTIGVGSVVVVGFFDRDIENWNGSGNYNLRTRRMHDLNDSFVEAVIE